MAEDTKDKIVRYLEDAYGVEQGALKALQSLIDESTDSDLKAAASQHLQETQSQAQRVEARLTALGGKVNAAKGVLDSVVALGSHIVNAFHDKADKQTQDVIKAASLEQFEASMYASLKAYASAVGDTETAQLADTIMGEELIARDKLAGLVPQVAVLSVAKATDATVAV